jgi:hypothetical protein
MSELALPFALFGVLISVIGIMVAIKTEYMNNFLSRVLAVFDGDRLTERHMIRGTRSSGIVIAIGGLVVTAVAIFVLGRA